MDVHQDCWAAGVHEANSEWSDVAAPLFRSMLEEAGVDPKSIWLPMDEVQHLLMVASFAEMLLTLENCTRK